MISVLLSGRGSTLKNLIGHGFGILRVVSNRDCPGLKVAEEHGLPALILPRNCFSSLESWSEALFDADVKLHVLAGFLAKVHVPARWKGRILNIHPSLLPAFGGQGMYGHHVHEAVSRAGVSQTGATVHLVDDEYDHGEIVAQKTFEIVPGSDPEFLREKVQRLERELYPAVIRDYLQLLP